MLTFRVTGTKPGFTQLVRTASTAAVAPGTITNSAPPSITGVAALGGTLTGIDGSWTPADVALAREWVRDGSVIATGATYAPVAADVGKVLTFRVTGTKPGHTTLVRTAATQPVVDPSAVVDNTVTPTITGTAAVGQVLTAADGAWTPDGVTLTRQWKRDGDVIAGATGTTYTLAPADLGTAITVTVTGSKAGHVSDEATSAPTAAVALGTITATKPKISGTLKVGKTLTAKPGTSTPSVVTVKYQWLRNGKAIRKATKSKYKLTTKDKGRKISLKVTRAVTGYTTLALTSAQTSKIKG